LLPLVTQRIQSRLRDQSVILGKVVDELNILINRACIVIHASECGNQAASQSGNLRLSGIGRKRSATEERDLFQIELFEAVVVTRFCIGVRHRGEIFAVIRRILQQAGEQLSGLLELFRTGRLTRSFVAELRAQPRVRILCGLQKHRNRLGLHLHAPVEVNRRTNNTENPGILAIERLDIFLRGCEIFAALVEPDQGIP